MLEARFGGLAHSADFLGSEFLLRDGVGFEVASVVREVFASSPAPLYTSSLLIEAIARLFTDEDVDEDEDESESARGRAVESVRHYLDQILMLY